MSLEGWAKNGCALARVVPIRMKPTSKSAFALPFEAAIEPSTFVSHIKQAAESQLLSDLAKNANSALGLALSGAKVVLEAGTIQVVFEKGIPTGAKFMKSFGEKLPVLVDGRTNRIISLGRVASKGRAAVSIAASSTLVVIEAAHFISGHDNAKRLKKVERSIDRLVLAHESELKSKLEAIYRFSKELLHSNQNELSDHDCRIMHLQTRELMELRARWRDDFRCRLNQIERAEPGLINKALWWRRENAEAKSRQEKASEANKALEIVQLMHFSLLLQMTISASAGRIDAFCTVTLEDECVSWRSLVELCRKRSDEIAGLQENREFADFLNAIEDLAELWTPTKMQAQGVALPTPKPTKLKDKGSSPVKRRTTDLKPTRSGKPIAKKTRKIR
jgi:hypothetical protein